MAIQCRTPCCCKAAGRFRITHWWNDAAACATPYSLPYTNQTGIFFQGDNAIGGGAGATFGDGLRCCGANVVKLEIVDPPGGGSPTTVQMTASVTTSGPAGTVVPGGKKCYQYFYRDTLGGVCGSSFNLSNAVLVTWGA